MDLVGALPQFHHTGYTRQQGEIVSQKPLLQIRKTASPHTESKFFSYIELIVKIVGTIIYLPMVLITSKLIRVKGNFQVNNIHNSFCRNSIVKRFSFCVPSSRYKWRQFGMNEFHNLSGYHQAIMALLGAYRGKTAHKLRCRVRIFDNIFSSCIMDEEKVESF